MYLISVLFRLHQNCKDYMCTPYKYICLINGLYFPWQKLKNNLYRDLKKHINECNDARTNKNCLNHQFCYHTQITSFSTFIILLYVSLKSCHWRFDTNLLYGRCYNSVSTCLPPSFFLYHHIFGTTTVQWNPHLKCAVNMNIKLMIILNWSNVTVRLLN